MYRSQNILVDKIIEGIQEKKGYDIAIVNLENIEETICNYFIICQGNSPSHVTAITESVAKFAREQAVPNRRPWTDCAMPSGWRWTIPTLSCISLLPTHTSSMIWKICGPMPTSQK